MVVFLHEPNSVGRAKLRRLTTLRGLTLQQIAEAIDYSRPALSMAVNGHSAGSKLIRAIVAFTDGDIAEKDWQTPYRGDVDAIPIFEGRGRPRNATAEEALPRPVRQHLRVVRLRQRARRSPSRGT